MATHQYITKTEGVLGGKARLKGHRISVVDIVEHLEAGETPTAVAEHLQITPEEVEAAREYYERHSDEIDNSRQQREELYEELQDQSRAPSS